mmetsp:Transcript_67903/g.102427  ORF Transcript_67903/g.102427 Transcript_67903/m.102427 type:complete len:239 (+) Transcript_67903:1697-2413(+)
MFLFVRVIEDAPLLKKTESFFLKSYFIVFRTSKITLKANKEKTPTIKFKFTGPSFLSRKNLKKDFKKREHFTRIKPFESGIFFFSILGTIETFYLFFQKLKETPVFCVNQTCSIVLNSSFSEIFGIPLVFFGLFSYFLISFFTLERVIKAEKSSFFLHEKTTHWALVLFGSIDLYFIFILEWVLKTSCIYCLFSVFFSGSVLFLKTLAQTGCETLHLNLLVFLEIFIFFFFLIIKKNM